MDQLLKIWGFIEPRLRVLMFLAFAGMLGAVAFIAMSESPYGQGAETAGSGKAIELSDDREPAQRIQNVLYDNSLAMKESEFTPLIANNMFSVKTVKDQTEREAEANRKYEQAKRLRDEGKFDEAMNLVDQVLAVMQSHRQALRLKEELEARLKP